MIESKSEETLEQQEPHHSLFRCHKMAEIIVSIQWKIQSTKLTSQAAKPYHTAAPIGRETKICPKFVENKVLDILYIQT